MVVLVVCNCQGRYLAVLVPTLLLLLRPYSACRRLQRLQAKRAGDDEEDDDDDDDGKAATCW